MTDERLLWIGLTLAGVGFAITTVRDVGRRDRSTTSALEALKAPSRTGWVFIVALVALAVLGLQG